MKRTLEVLCGHCDRFRHVAVVLILLVVQSPLQGQRPAVENYRSEHGLAQSVVFSIFQDRQGYIWFATPSGLSRYDGIQFRNYGLEEGLPDNVVRTVVQLEDGIIWAGTDHGPAFLNPGEKNFQEVDLLSGVDLGIRCIMEGPAGSKWFGTYNGGVVRVDAAGEATQLGQDVGLPHDRVRACLRDREDRLWFGTYGGGVVFWDDNRFITFGPEEGLSNLSVRSLLETSRGEILVGTNGGVFRYTGYGFEPYLEASVLVNEAVTSMVEDSKGRLWMGTRESGVCRYQSEVTCLRKGLGDNTVYSVFEDREQNMWIGTWGGGVDRLADDAIQIVTQADGLPIGGVRTILQKDDGFWIGTTGGAVSLIKDGKIEPQMTYSGPEVTGSFLDGDRILFTTIDGVFSFENGRFEPFELPLEDWVRVAYDVAKDAKGNLWIATYSGLVEVTPSGEKRVYSTEDGLPSMRIHSILVQDEGLWLATGNGISYLNKGVFTNYGVSDGLPDPFVEDIYRSSDGAYWLTTSNGLSRFEKGAFANFTTQDGLPHAHCTSILEDDLGRLWVGTTRGIAIMDGENIRVMTVRDGLPSSESLARGALKDTEGRLWFGTGRGVVVFDGSADYSRNLPAPPVHITNVEVEGKQVPLTEHELTLAWDHSDLFLEFIGISFAFPDLVEYQYRFVGREEEWKSTSSRTLRLPVLPTGNYTFEVRARIGDGPWSLKPAQLSLEVPPPFWRTTWFPILVLLTLATGVFYGHRLTLRNIRQRAEELEEVVEFRNRTEETLRRYATELEQASLYDGLTKLPNRALFQDRLRGAVELQQDRHQYTFAVLFVDLNNFKLINDSYSHRDGDEILIDFAQRLRRLTMPGDTVARLGADDFALLLHQVETAVDATRVAQDIHENLKEPFHVGGKSIHLSASIGVALFGGLADDYEDIMREADTALHRSKRNGRGKTEVFDPIMHEHVLHAMELERLLRIAIEKKQFSLHYQPIEDVKRGETKAFEALIRWNHPEEGLLLPGQFLKTARTTGLDVILGNWILEEAVRQAARWSQKFAQPPAISVNLFHSQVLNPELTLQIKTLLNRWGVNPSLLRLEVTEEVLIEDTSRVIAALEEIRALDIKIYLDDFGSGYSSLSYLEKFPVDVLKIDRSFIQKLEKSTSSGRIIESIIHLAKVLDLEVVAEGVETQDQYDQLVEIGCNFIQGFHLSQAMTVHHAEDYFKKSELIRSR